MNEDELSTRAADKEGAEEEDSSPAEEIKVVVAGEEETTPAPQEPHGPSREELIEAFNKSREEAKALRDKMLRVMADADNQRKRLAREREEIIKFGQEKLMRDLIVPLDNLERSLSHLPTEGVDPALAALRDGVAMVLRQLLDTLAGYGLRGFSALGQAFDPNLHEAVDKLEDAERPPDTVISEISKGYMLHDRLLRPALVTVTMAPAPTAPVESGDGEPPGEGETS